MSLLPILLIGELVFGLVVVNRSYIRDRQFFPKFNNASISRLLADDTSAPADSSSGTDTDASTDTSTGADTSGDAGSDAGTSVDAGGDAGADAGGDASGDGSNAGTNDGAVEGGETVPENGMSNSSEQNPESSQNQEQQNEQQTQGEQSQGSENNVEQQSGEQQTIEQNTLQQNEAPAKEFSDQEAQVINETASINTPDSISQQVLDKTDNEETKIAEATTPQEEASVLVNLAEDKVSDIGSLVQNNDFDSTNFLVQRLSDQIDQALNDVGGLDSQNPSLKQGLENLAEKADIEFRSVQLVVPEKMEQDFEIARGKFLNIELTK